MGALLSRSASSRFSFSFIFPQISHPRAFQRRPRARRGDHRSVPPCSPPCRPIVQMCLFDDWLPRVIAREAAAALREPRSPLMRELLEILRRAARLQAVAPTNAVLTIQTRAVRQTPARGVRQLADDGYFRIETKPQYRRFVFPDGTATGWGDFRKGHAPGPRRTTPPAVIRAPNSQPLRPLVAPAPALRLRPARECQFLHWPDDLRPPADIDAYLCQSASLPGKSWCEEHYAVVFLPRRRSDLLNTTSECFFMTGGVT